MRSPTMETAGWESELRTQEERQKSEARLIKMKDTPPTKSSNPSLAECRGC